VDPRAGLDDVEERKFLTLPGLELLPLGRPARSQSLYRLRYPGSRKKTKKEKKKIGDDHDGVNLDCSFMIMSRGVLYVVTNISEQPTPSIFRTEIATTSTLKLETAGSSETLVTTYMTTRPRNWKTTK
jgi:hypothetical protein